MDSWDGQLKVVSVIVMLAGESKDLKINVGRVSQSCWASVMSDEWWVIHSSPATTQLAVDVGPNTRPMKDNL
jgi:hypothetical protein